MNRWTIRAEHLKNDKQAHNSKEQEQEAEIGAHLVFQLSRWELDKRWSVWWWGGHHHDPCYWDCQLWRHRDPCSEDTDVSVLLVYCLYRMELESTCRRTGVTEKCWFWMPTLPRAQVVFAAVGMRARSGCDTTSYTHAKGKINVLNTLLTGDLPSVKCARFTFIAMKMKSPEVSQCVLALSAGPSAVHAVENGRAASPTWWVSQYHSAWLGDPEWRSRCCYLSRYLCLGILLLIIMYF